MNDSLLLISLLFLMVVLWLGGYAVCTLLTLMSSVKPGERFLFAFPMGAAILSWLAFCVGEFGHIPIDHNFVYVVSLLLAGFGIGFGVKHLRDWWRLRLEKTVQNEPQNSVSHWSWLAWTEAAVILMLAIRQILESWTTPIVFSDSVIHHLPFAKIVYQTHALPEYADP
jgi:hypothetical protein